MSPSSSWRSKSGSREDRAETDERRKSGPKQERFEQLDGLRGLAALSVGLSHHLLVFQGTASAYTAAKTIGNVAKYAPTYPLTAGYESVVLFFVLSGFVLSLPWLREERPKYGRFLLRRILRLYVPYLVATGIAVGVATLIRDLPYGRDLGAFVATRWTRGVDLRTVLDHVGMIHHFDGSSLNPVIWSLVVEMRASIVFPIIAWLAIERSVLGAFAIALSCTVIRIVVGRYLADETSIDYLTTVHFMGLFIFGALAARLFPRLRGGYRALKSGPKLLVFVLAWLAYAYGRIASHFVAFSSDWIIAAASVVFFVAVVETDVGNRIVKTRLVRFLGEISFSYYLVHAVVLFAVFRGAGERLDPLSATLLSLFGGLAVAWGFHRLVERPTMELARRLRSSVRGR